jgi:glycosyltransferase involved in cell wall biosynthesis
MTSPPLRGAIHLWLPALSESTGGIQSFSQELLRALIANREPQPIQVFIKNDGRFHCDFAAANLRVFAFGRWPEGPTRTAVFALWLVIRTVVRRPKLIVVGHANFARVAMWLSWLCGIPYWVILHGIEVWDEKGARVGKYLHDAKRLLVVSRFTRDKVAREQGLDMPLFSLMQNTVDGDRFRPGPKSASLRSRLGIPSEARIILTVCRLVRDELYKGYDQILAVLPELRTFIPEAHFLLAGTGDDAARIQSEVNKKGLESCVTLSGHVPDHELVDYYNLCDVFAMPSRREGFGIVFLEALACGKPVLAGNGDGATEALRDGELGVLVNPEEPGELSESLAAMLVGTHPHPLIFKPTELRRLTLEYFGREQFARRLNSYLEESLGSPSTV